MKTGAGLDTPSAALGRVDGRRFFSFSSFLQEQALISTMEYLDALYQATLAYPEVGLVGSLLTLFNVLVGRFVYTRLRRLRTPTVREFDPVFDPVNDTVAALNPSCWWWSDPSHQTTLVNVANNTLNVGVDSYGQVLATQGAFNLLNFFNRRQRKELSTNIRRLLQIKKDNDTRAQRTALAEHYRKFHS